MSHISSQLFEQDCSLKVGEVALSDQDSLQSYREKLARIIVDEMYQFVGLLDAITSFETALTWPETQQRIQNVLQRGLQRDSDFETRRPEVLGTLVET